MKLLINSFPDVRKVRKLILSLLVFPLAQTAFAQADTIRLTLPQAEELFLRKNFVLLAQKYNVNLAEAAVQQARLWDNPNLQVEVNAYNPNTGKLFPLVNRTHDPMNPSGGSYSWQLQQMINLAGRRSKLVALNQTSVDIQQATFQDVMRALRFQLAQTFGNLQAEQAQVQLLQEERQRLSGLIDAFRARLKLGVVAEYEVTRLELEQKNADADLSRLQAQISQDEASLRVLLADAGTTYYVPDMPASTAAQPELNKLLDEALAQRPDLQVALKQGIFASRNLTYQKSLATPQLLLGADYERFGNAYPSYLGLQVGMDLPVKNRNQGNIQAAKVGIEQAKDVTSQAELQVRQDVISAWQQWQNALALKAGISDDYLGRIAEISRNATADYQKRVIDQVSFIDKIRSYKDAQLNLIQLNNQVFQAQQQLNFVTNTHSF